MCLQVLTSSDHLNPRFAGKTRPSTHENAYELRNSGYPPLPQNETAVALNTANENIAVAASNDYVDGGVTVMRTANGGRSWQTTRVVPVYHHAGDPLS